MATFWLVLFVWLLPWTIVTRSQRLEWLNAISLASSFFSPPLFFIFFFLLVIFSHTVAIFMCYISLFFLLIHFILYCFVT